jgi:hypothetical protein
MKIQTVLFLFSLVFGLISCSTEKRIVQIPTRQSAEIDYPEYETYKATLKNSARADVEVKVLNKETGESVSSFGLENGGKAEVSVGQNAKIVLTNSSKKDAKLKIAIRENIAVAPIAINDNREYINFTLRNNTVQSIPLIIPNVMNPNLSPFSNSGVSLKVGQEILFKANGKKQVLLVVSKSIKDGEVLDVAAVLKERKKQLRLE